MLILIDYGDIKTEGESNDEFMPPLEDISDVELWLMESF